MLLAALPTMVPLPAMAPHIPARGSQPELRGARNLSQVRRGESELLDVAAEKVFARVERRLRAALDAADPCRPRPAPSLELTCSSLPLLVPPALLCRSRPAAGALAPPESRSTARAARRFSLSYVLWLLSEREEVPPPLRTDPLPLPLLYRAGAALSGGAWAQANAILQGIWRGPFLLPTVPLPRPNGSNGPTRAQGGCVLQRPNGSNGPARPSEPASRAPELTRAAPRALRAQRRWRKRRERTRLSRPGGSSRCQASTYSRPGTRSRPAPLRTRGPRASRPLAAP